MYFLLVDFIVHMLLFQAWVMFGMFFVMWTDDDFDSDTAEWIAMVLWPIYLLVLLARWKNKRIAEQ